MKMSSNEQKPVIKALAFNAQWSNPGARKDELESILQKQGGMDRNKAIDVANMLLRFKERNYPLNQAAINCIIECAQNEDHQFFMDTVAPQLNSQINTHAEGKPQLPLTLKGSKDNDYGTILPYKTATIDWKCQTIIDELDTLSTTYKDKGETTEHVYYPELRDHYEESKILNETYMNVAPTIKKLSDDIKEALNTYHLDMEKAQGITMQEQAAGTAFATTVDRLFKNTLQDKSVSQHQNILSRLWEGFKEFCNQHLHTHFDIKKTNREIKVSSIHQKFFKDEKAAPQEPLVPTNKNTPNTN
jgi:hypothetical protein